MKWTRTTKFYYINVDGEMSIYVSFSDEYAFLKLLQLAEKYDITQQGFPLFAGYKGINSWMNRNEFSIKLFGLSIG